MIYKELQFYFRKFKTITLLTYVAVTSLLLILGTFFSFIDQLKYEISDLGQIYEDKIIFEIVDGYYEGDAFQSFMDAESALKSLEKFYSGLNQTDKFIYLAMNDQHIFIEEKNLDHRIIRKKDEEMQGKRVNIEGQNYIPIQSFQMNENSFKYFGIEVASGNSWTSDDFEDKGVHMPILLGSSYLDMYKVGDIIPINYYTKNIKAEVKGFINSNEKVFYMGETEFYLDDYILMPYISYSSPRNLDDEYFQKISYFSMVNGYLITSNNTSAIQAMMDYIEILSDRANFEKYSFIGMNPQFQKYNGLMKTMEENKDLVTYTLLLTFCINLLMITILLILQQNRRLNYYAVHFINGAGKKDMLIRILVEVGTIMMLSLVTSILFLELIFKIGSVPIYLILFMIILLLILLSSLFPMYKLIKYPIAEYLRYDENEGGV